MKPSHHVPFVATLLAILFLTHVTGFRSPGHPHGQSRQLGRHVKSNNIEIVENSPLAPRSDILARQSVSSDPGQTSSTTTSGDFTCGVGKPCGNGACCGESGWCGYGDTYCGTGCQSNCDATAECGKNAATPGQKCPLNVCCSEFGFCGTTEEFCTGACQSNCPQPKPSVAKSNVQNRVIAYYEGWSDSHKCGVMAPEEIPVNSLTHLIFAFAFITPGTFKITNMDGVTSTMFKRVTQTKKKNPSLKVMIALGGWTFNDPGIWQQVFHDIASTAANRATFIKNLMGFLSEYAFDGCDIDWEYPGADDRGGSESDGVNFTQLLKEIKAAFDADPHGYLLTFTAPTSYWYLRHFDITEMTKHVDWINLMAYDLHGVWDRNNPIGAQVLAHSNLTEIDLALDLFWRNDIDPAKIVLGLGFYGRSFKLSDPTCWKPGCPFSGPGDAGSCTGAEGILSYKEIEEILVNTKATPFWDSDAQVNYITYGDNNWISFDNEKSIQAKIDFANQRGLAGLMIWAIDIDNSKGTLLQAITGKEISEDGSDILQFDLDLGPAISHSTLDLTRCTISDCNKDGDTLCAVGTTPLTRINIKDGKRCSTSKDSEARFICCPSFASPKPDDCHWADQRSSAAHSDCNGKCDVGEIELAGDSFGWTGGLFDGKYGDRCGRGGKVFCCKAGNMQRYLDICTWTGCNENCPADKPHLFTTDSGGPKANKRCKSSVGSASGGGSPFDPEPAPGRRKFCCPAANSFNPKTCGWKSGKVCSESCGINQITLDTDPQGPGGRTCDNGREQAYCCDPPGGLDQPFTPFDLDTLFPPEYLPPASAVPSYELISFDGVAALNLDDPNLSGLAFFLLAGSSTALSRMTKRDGQNGMEFLDCPAGIFEQAVEAHQTARVICMGDKHEECFAVREGGVEGTVVKMPQNCGEGSYARVVSLQLSKNQSVPAHVAKRNPSSAVFDFVFDYNVALARRDAGSFSMRIDYSNVPGYWNAVVDSAGVKKKRDLKTLVDRFYSGTAKDWFDKFATLTPNSKLADALNEPLTTLIYDEGKSCDTGVGDVGESISVGINGRLVTSSYYGFSTIATWTPGTVVQVHQAAGFYRAEGHSDVIFKVGGRGTLDISQKLGGETLTKRIKRSATGGHSLYHGWAYFNPYFERGVSLSTRGGNNGAVSFEGYMEGTLVSEFGKMNVNFPDTAPPLPDIGTAEGQRPEDLLSKENVLKPIGDNPRGSITVASTIQLGLQVGLSFSKPNQFDTPNPFPDMSVYQETYAQFSISGDSSRACVATSMGTTLQGRLSDGASVGWPSGYKANILTELAEAGTSECFTEAAAKAKLKKKRQNNSLPTLPDLGPDIPTVTINLDGREFDSEVRAIPCANCQSCFEYGSTIRTPCCGCAWLPPDPFTGDEALGDDLFGSIPFPTDPGLGAISKRGMIEITGELSGSQAKEYAALDPLSESLAKIDIKGVPLSGTLEDVEEHYNTSESPNIELRSFTLDKRVGGGVGSGKKSATICDVIVKSKSYPQFPNYRLASSATKNWDADTLAVGVARYYHNATADCQDWDVQHAATYDQIFYNPRTNTPAHTQFHQTYETEHVFESQTISRFFNNWLPFHASTIRNCFWVGSWITAADSHWAAPGITSFAGTMMNELGSTTKRDRLTVFLAQSNGHKGRLFSGSVAISPAKYNAMTSDDQQFLALREIGMIFTYLNRPEVWDIFCDTYNGMLDRLTEFDAYYNAIGATGALNGPPSNLAAEWPNHVRSELDMVVAAARTNIIFMWQNRRGPITNLIWLSRWWRVLTGSGVPLGGQQFQKINLNQVGNCRNLPAAAPLPIIV